MPIYVRHGAGSYMVNVKEKNLLIMQLIFWLQKGIKV